VPPARRPPARRAPGLVIGDAPRLGPDDAPVTIVEFSDFQCHFCARAATTLQQLSRAYAGQVRIVFKHYPLSSHPGAPLAHEASLAAHAQGKFWEMHRLLMANQTRQTRAHLVEYAQQIGLDVDAFTQALDSRQFRGKVMSDVSEGRRIFVGMTPTYFINGRRFVGAQPLSAFRSAVERALSAARPAATE
jgi:protein-disulfide isomerase